MHGEVIKSIYADVMKEELKEQPLEEIIDAIVLSGNDAADGVFIRRTNLLYRECLN